MLGPFRLLRPVGLAAPAGPGLAPTRWPGWVCSAGRHLGTGDGGQNDVSKDALDTDPLEAELEALVRKERIKRKTIRFHQTRRQLSESGAPERTLTWDAIQQIRYLKQESPQEWTVRRLADSFSVCPDAVSRVLRSKFVPAAERKLKQDSKVLAAVRPLSLGDGQTECPGKDRARLPVPAGPPAAALSQSNAGALTAPNPKALAPRESEANLVPSGARTTPRLSTPAPSAVPERPEENRDPEGLAREEDEEWDRVFLTEEELEELVETLRERPSAVEQKGSEFFDTDGNFLYRI